MAQKWMALGGAAGGVTILDLHSGALSMDENFVDAYEQAKSKAAAAAAAPDGSRYDAIYNESDFGLYGRIKTAVQASVVATAPFGIETEIHLTSPTFFSKITSKPAVTEHDE